MYELILFIPTYSLISFSYPSFIPTVIPGLITDNVWVSITWSPILNSFVIGDSVGTMYTYKVGINVLNTMVGPVGPYSAYSPIYGQIYNVSPLACSNTIISNVYSSSFDGGNTWIPNGTGTTSSIAYSSRLNQFFTLQPLISPTSNTYSIGFPIDTTTTMYPTPLSAFQASLPVEYVFLADEEVKYIQSAKVDYVITQLQLASTVVPGNINSLNAYRLYFINPTKELFFMIQDKNVLALNDYYNYMNTTTNTEQLINLELQFNGEDIISQTVADNLYLGKVQFLNNHTRLPNMDIYNYSFAIDPENYLPTGQVNMSRIMNQNIWMWLTPSAFDRDIRIYAKAYNILRIQNGLAGVLFMDNNFI